MSAQSATRKKALLGLLVTGLLVGGAAAGWCYLARNSETTDDAYVAGNVVPVSARIAGNVVSIHADDTQLVKAGAALVELDQTDAKLALLQAETQLAQAVRSLTQQQAQLQQYDAMIALRRAELARLQGDQSRREVLGLSNAVGREEVLHARNSVEEGKAALDVAIAERNALQAKLQNTRLQQQPEVLHAAEQVREAWLALQRTRIVSPVDGVVAKRSVQVGAHVTQGAPLLAVVPLEQLWVDANFKEIQLEHIRIGQPVELTADVYGDKQVYHGKVLGLAAGTGSVFSLLPAQNATGNWLKVVQRLPVRISLDPAELRQHPLRLGLSMLAKVDISDHHGDSVLAANADRPVASTAVLDVDMQEIDGRIARIIADNSHAG